MASETHNANVTIVTRAWRKWPLELRNAELCNEKISKFIPVLLYICIYVCKYVSMYSHAYIHMYAG